MITELKNRRIADVFVICCDGLKGFPQAIEAVFPQTIVRTCIVHLIVTLVATGTVLTILSLIALGQMRATWDRACKKQHARPASH